LLPVLLLEIKTLIPLPFRNTLILLPLLLLRDQSQTVQGLPAMIFRIPC
jgi:hypothetical protein